MTSIDWARLGSAINRDRFRAIDTRVIIPRYYAMMLAAEEGIGLAEWVKAHPEIDVL